MAAPETDVSKTTISLVASEANHMESAVSALKRRLNDDKRCSYELLESELQAEHDPS
ncbi:hypothetical protein HPP92_027939 [Vanilla planifolia]|uniref:Uncharacterized protein n=2 Tax=Vanilla planifolia TaxID=51239 RepID=A0A835PAN9_VANPL|nr:hypothetical protein HPP92_027939 [Vanilla planifolia]